MLIMIFTTIVLLYVGVEGSSGKLDYDKQDEWGGACNDSTYKRQSPIDLDHADVNTTQKMPFLAGDDSDRDSDSELKVDLKNEDDVNTIKFSFSEEEDSAVVIEVPGLTGVKAKAKQLHLHWGAADNEGSEHRVKGKQFALETHLVCEKIKESRTMNSDETDSEDNSLVVFARLYAVGEENEQIGEMIAAQRGSEDRNLDDFELNKLYGPMKEVYTYSGGLTTPDCNEIVHWVVRTDSPLTVSTDQLQQLRDLGLGSGNSSKVSHNWRLLQPRNNRNITRISRAERGVVWTCATVVVAFLASLF